MRRGRFYRIIQFDVGQLGVADDALLRFRGQRVPSVQVVEIFLHDHVAAAGERGILLADERGVDHCLTARVFGAVDEPQEVAVIEVTKAVDLVDRRDHVTEARHDLRRHLEAKVHPLRTDMEQQVPWRRSRMVRSGPDLPERVEFGWTRVPEQPGPMRRTRSLSRRKGRLRGRETPLRESTPAGLRKTIARPCDCPGPDLSSPPGRSQRG